MGKVVQLFDTKDKFKELLVEKYGEVINQVDDEALGKIKAKYAEDITVVTNDVGEAYKLVSEFVAKATEELGSVLVVCGMLDYIVDVLATLKIEKELPTDDEMALLYDKVLAIELDKRLNDAVGEVTQDVVAKALQEE